MEPLEKVRDADGKGGAEVEEFSGLRTTIIRLSTCSSVKALVLGELDSEDEKTWLPDRGTAGAKSGTAAESGVCMNDPLAGFPFTAEEGLAATNGRGTPLGIENWASSILQLKLNCGESALRSSKLEEASGPRLCVCCT